MVLCEWAERTQASKTDHLVFRQSLFTLLAILLLSQITLHCLGLRLMETGAELADALNMEETHENTCIPHLL